MVDLFKAAYANDVEGVRAAIAEGQDPNLQHPNAGTLPLQLACQGDSTGSIRELLLAGADPNRQFSRVSRIDGRRFGSHTPLMYVRSVEAATLLLDAGANLEVRDEDGRTPLVWAVHRGAPAIFECFLMRGGRVDIEVPFENRSLTLLQFVDRQRARVAELGGANVDGLLADLERIRDMLLRYLTGEETNRPA